MDQQCSQRGLEYKTYHNNLWYQWNLKKMTPVDYRNHLLQVAFPFLTSITEGRFKKGLVAFFYNELRDELNVSGVYVATQRDVGEFSIHIYKDPFLLFINFCSHNPCIRTFLFILNKTLNSQKSFFNEFRVFLTFNYWTMISSIRYSIYLT